MKPLDDELRAVLTSRAGALPLVPDPVVGIEERARRMRRHRIGAAMAGAALAVSAVAVGVPALTSGSSTESLPTVATTPTQSPTEAPSEPSPPTSPPSPFALDPAEPWVYRGTPVEELGTGFLRTAQREYAVARGVPESSLTMTPLFGQVYVSSQQAELVFVALVDGEARWGIVQEDEAGPELLVDLPLAPGTTALPAALPGDEGVERLLVTASPEVGKIQYRARTAGQFLDMTPIEKGVAIAPLEGDPSTDRLRVLDQDGEFVFDGPAPDPTSYAPSMPPGEDEGPETQEPPLADVPANMLDWPQRGEVSEELLSQAIDAFARAIDVMSETVSVRVLYARSYEGRNVMLLQAWTRGEDARTFGYLEAAGNETTWLGQVTAPGPAVLGFLVPAEAAFLPNDLLLVVPEPAAEQVLYGGEDGAATAPVPDQGTGAAVLIDRVPGARGDQLFVLERAGDPESTLYADTVADLLATF